MRPITTHNPENRPGQLEIEAVETRTGLSSTFQIIGGAPVRFVLEFGPTEGLDRALVAILHDREMARIAGKSREGGDEAPELLQRLLEIFNKRGAG